MSKRKHYGNEIKMFIAIARGGTVLYLFMVVMARSMGDETMSKRKAKFKVGQVVYSRHDGRCRKVARVQENLVAPDGYIYFFEHGFQAEVASDYRALTRKERGNA